MIFNNLNDDSDKKKDRNSSGIKKTEIAIIITTATMILLLASQFAINWQILSQFDPGKPEHKDFVIQIIKDNNDMYKQLVAASLIFLGIGISVASNHITNNKKSN